MSKDLREKLVEILTYLVVPRGQVIPYNEGDQKSAEMAGVLLDYWAKREAAPLINQTTDQILELVRKDRQELLKRIEVSLEKVSNPRNVDQGNETYNLNAKDFRMGYTIAHGQAIAIINAIRAEI